uniref:Uncharacterized protein n=1 Tax=Rhizophagus irregularis (strain DAOM 181602 / DAOM 197198 / MUCL 43194) TaxID=747089 RepID=U9T1M6_RHIID
MEFLDLGYKDSITNSQPPTGNTEYSSSILSTVPERNAVIIPGANQITITYKMNDIKPSIGYITISQKNTIEGEEIRHTFLRLMMTFVEVNGQNLTGSSWEVSTAPGSGSNEPGKLL